VIHAIGAGKRAAQGMLEFMGVLTPETSPELVLVGGVLNAIDLSKMPCGD
jgi:hypothetical protein